MAENELRHASKLGRPSQNPSTAADFEPIASQSVSEHPMPIGTRVLMYPPHPWAGHCGHIVDWEVFNLLPEDGERPIIELDNGMRTTYFDPTQCGRYPQEMYAAKLQEDPE